MIADVLAEGRLIRHDWSRTDADGRQLLCLYTAMLGDPEARPDTCPADVCPAWLAHLLPWIDDAGSAERWPDVIARVARLAPRFAQLPPATEWRVRALCVRKAMRHTDDADALAVCERVASLCETGDPDQDELLAARVAAEAARVAAKVAAARARAAAKTAKARVAAEAARVAAEAAEAAAWAANAAAAEAAEAAARAAARAAAARAAARAAKAANAVNAAADAAATRLIDAILDEIEAAVRLEVERG